MSFVLYFMFHTIYPLPHYALGPELTLDYHERSRLFGCREGFTRRSAPWSPPRCRASSGAARQRDAATSAFARASSAVLLATLLLEPRRAACASGPTSRSAPSNPFVPGVRRALRNRAVPHPARASTWSARVAGAIPGTLMPFFNAYVIQPENETVWLAVFLAVYFGAGFLCLPAWIWAARRFGKKPTWLRELRLGDHGLAAHVLRGRGRHAADGVLILAWAGSSFGARLFLGPAIQADVIDYDELLHRQAPRGAVRRVLVDDDEVRRDPERCDPDRGARVARLRAERRAERRR